MSEFEWVEALPINDAQILALLNEARDLQRRAESWWNADEGWKGELTSEQRTDRAEADALQSLAVGVQALAICMAIQARKR